MAKKIRQRLEENGLYESEEGHWEFFRATIYKYPSRAGAQVLIPGDIVRHLKLVNRDSVYIAVQRAFPLEEVTESG